MNTVSNEMVNETVGEIICEICSDIFEWVEIERATIDMIMINEEYLFSVKDNVTSEVRSAMLSHADGHCKCADEVVKLKKELKKCHETIQELTAKLKLYLLPFCEESLTDNSTVSFYTRLPTKGFEGYF